jgi:ribosomal-protein-alanine N-acetyltransferase
MLLRTIRLELVPMTLAMAEAVVLGHKDDAERLVDARMPLRWPNRELVERAFSASLEAIRANPGVRLWGNRVLVRRPADGEARVVGSVVFHGRPDDGIAEIAYGIEDGSQGQGYATEAVAACLAWALDEEGILAVQAATFDWHVPSLRVIGHVGMTRVGTREHDTMGELVVFERRR